MYGFAQTANGYLWIATDAGLVRFDGSAFQTITEDAGTSNFVPILGLMADVDGNLWARSHTPWLLRYRDGVLQRSIAGEPYINFTAMCRTNEGTLLASAAEQGAVVYRNGKFAMVTSFAAMPRSPIFAIAQTSVGDIWTGTRDVGLFRVSKGQIEAVNKGLPDLKVNCLLAGKDGELWVGTDKGVARWNGSELIPVETGGASRRLQAVAMVRDRDRNLWVGTDSRGLLRINDRGTTALSTSPSEAVTAVFEDREGNVWIGTASGIERLRDSPFVTYSVPEGVPADGGTPIFVDSENRVWFAPASGGLWWLKDEQKGRVNQAALERDVVYSITGTGTELWLGRQRGGLTRLRIANGSFATKTYTQTDGLPQNSVYSVHQTGGVVWAGTLSGGVSKFEDGKFTTYTVADGLASNTVVAILEASDKTTWFATPSGLTALTAVAWRSYTTTNGLPSANVNCLLEDSSGLIWAGTAAGLAFGGSKGFQAPKGLPASLHEQILGISEDRYGWLWLATSNHVVRVKREAVLKGAILDGDLHEYGLADGLRGVEGVKRHQSVFADSVGKIWFSMNRGISVVDPARLTSSSVPAIVHIQSIAADGRSINMRDRMTIPGGSQRITFGYAGLSLSVPERVRFRYTLDGFDHGWSQPVAAREAVYTNLSPRSYRFRVIASNPDGVWNSAESSIGFEIAPQFWQTLWFQVSSVLAIAFAIAALYRLRLLQMSKQLSVRFEERLAERTRIAQELHDTLLQGFLSASMQLHVAVDRLPDDSPVRPSLNRVLQLVGQVIEEGRNSVRGLRSTDTSSGDLAQAFSRIREELAVDGEIDFRVIVEGQARTLHPVLRDDIYRIGREALVNAFRHARATKIEIGLEYTAKRFRFLVRDDGCGIDPRVLESGREGHWGLPGMRERADRIGAQLRVWSSPTAGTEIELSVPSHVAFELQHSNSRYQWLRGKSTAKETDG